MEIESIFSQPVARFVLRVCISVAGYFAQLLWKRPVVRRSYIPALTVSGDYNIIIMLGSINRERHHRGGAPLPLHATSCKVLLRIYVTVVYILHSFKDFGRFKSDILSIG